MKLDQADRKILLVGAAVLCVTLLISAAVSPSGETGQRYPSTYSADSDGAKAAYTLLPQLGYRVEHWQKPPDKLLEHGIDTVLVVAVPTQNVSGAFRENIRTYLLQGGRVLAVGPVSAQLLPRSEFEPGIPHFSWQTYHALLPTGITSNAPEIVMASASFWRRSDSDSQIDYGTGTRGVVVSYKYGKGEVIWWASADPLTNSGIIQANNLQLLLNSLGPAGARTILWDEFFHGGEPTMIGSLLASPLKWSLLQLGILGIVVLFSYARRHGPVRPFAVRTPMANLEFVETLGALYQRAGAAELPVQVAYERFRFLLNRKLGISVSAGAQQVANRLQDQLGDSAQDFEKVVSECESVRYQEHVDENESLRLVKSLEFFSKQLKLTSNPKE